MSQLRTMNWPSERPIDIIPTTPVSRCVSMTFGHPRRTPGQSGAPRATIRRVLHRGGERASENAWSPAAADSLAPMCASDSVRKDMRSLRTTI